MNQFKLTIVGIILGLLFPATALASPENYADTLAQVTNVNQLRDVSPTDWAYEALRSLSDRFLNGANAPALRSNFEPIGSVSLRTLRVPVVEPTHRVEVCGANSEGLCPSHDLSLRLCGETTGHINAWGDPRRQPLPKTALHRYNCIAGFPNNTYRGSQSLTRYEFAAGLNSCLNQIERLIAEGATVSDADLATLDRLSQDFATELLSLQGRVDNLESRVTTLEDDRFSTTTKLKGQALFAVNAGGFTGDEIIDPLGELITDSQPEATTLYRVSLDFDASFAGTDLLKIRVDTGSNGFDDNAANVLEPTFGSILNYSDSPPRDGEIGIGRAYYSFKPAESLQVAIGPAMVATDYIDFSQYTRPSFRGISTESLAQNYLLFPIEGPSGGAYTNWTFKEKFTIRATYNAAEAGDPNEDLSGIIPGLSTFTALLYPAESGDGGLFGDFYQGIIELEYAPIETVAVRLQYSGGEVFDSRFDVLGVNAEWQFLSRFAIFGRYSYGNYDDTAFGDIEPNYWMAGVSINDLLKEGSTLGIAAGQPFIASEIGNDTQTNFEAYYNYPLNEFIAVSPILQVITNASNQDANDTIYTGTIRTVFKF